jgi:hypothetical protein
MLPPTVARHFIAALGAEVGAIEEARHLTLASFRTISRAFVLRASSVAAYHQRRIAKSNGEVIKHNNGASANEIIHTFKPCTTSSSESGHIRATTGETDNSNQMRSIAGREVRNLH